MQPVRRHHAAARARGDPALPPDKAQRQQDGHPHDQHAQPFGLQRCGGGRQKPLHRAHGNGPGGDQDEQRLSQRGQILGRGMAEGVILVRGLGGIDQRGQRAQAYHQVHRAVGQRSGHRQRPGLPQRPELQPHQHPGYKHRGQTRRQVHADGGRQGHGGACPSVRPGDGRSLPKPGGRDQARATRNAAIRSLPRAPRPRARSCAPSRDRHRPRRGTSRAGIPGPSPRHCVRPSG